MKIRLFDQTKPAEQEVVLRLVPDHSTRGDGFNLVVVDPITGNTKMGGYLLHINSEGVRRYNGVSTVFGFTQDSHGKLAQRDEA